MPSLQSKKIGTTAHLSGVIDENSQLQQLDALGSVTNISFKDVSRINSCGVRDWVTWMKSRVDQATAYEACPLVIVKQLNSVPEFKKGATVSSFFAPYFCEPCDSEQLVLLEPAQIQNMQAPTASCPKCKGPLKFDAIAGQYFSFIDRK